MVSLAKHEPKTSRQAIVMRFWGLRFSQWTGIARRMRVHRDGDERLSDQERSGLVLRRIHEQGRWYELECQLEAIPLEAW